MSSSIYIYRLLEVLRKQENQNIDDRDGNSKSLDRKILGNELVRGYKTSKLGFFLSIIWVYTIIKWVKADKANSDAARRHLSKIVLVSQSDKALANWKN